VGSLAKRPPVVVYDDHTLREAADHMVRHGIGRLPVISRKTGDLAGIITRSDVLAAHTRRLKDTHEANRHIPFRLFARPSIGSANGS
jgi:signal-transduction protein with cAMP-binding, CBS, and nucleotidyltransferase domain